jgi:hypothetical protein|tara:strand:+ start:381 stop:647 length:267 start_codon:yes stop_codon:yes gene_type:complete
MTTATERKVLEVLPNGADALAVFEGPRFGVVLAHWKEEFITWEFMTGDKASTTSGNYHMYGRGQDEEEAYQDAQSDFLSRVTKNIKFI